MRLWCLTEVSNKPYFVIYILIENLKFRQFLIQWVLLYFFFFLLKPCADFGIPLSSLEASCRLSNPQLNPTWLTTYNLIHPFEPMLLCGYVSGDLMIDCRYQKIYLHNRVDLSPSMDIVYADIGKWCNIKISIARVVRVNTIRPEENGIYLQSKFHDQEHLTGWLVVCF